MIMQNIKLPVFILFILLNIINSELSPSIKQNPNTTIFNVKIDVNTHDDVTVPPLNKIDDIFEWKLLKEILLRSKENSIFSPFSVKLILSLLLEASGNNSETQNELSMIFSRSSTLDDVRKNFQDTVFDFKKKSEDYNLKIGTKMFLNNFITIGQKYEAKAKESYDVDVEQLNFSNVKNVLHTINSWSSNVTEGKISNLVSEDDIENAVMFIINTLYFEGLWAIPFPKINTHQLPFFKNIDKQINADFMVNTDLYNYFESNKLNAKILRLPYKGDKFSMVIILPNAKAGLDELIREISSDSVKRLQWLMDETQVKVFLPKIQFDNKINLKEILQTLGIKEVFTEKASLAGLARGEPVQNQLRLSNIFQKSGIIIEEKGSTAYAATVAGLENKFGGSTIEEFNANRPFLFFIQEDKTGVILFAGKIVDPAV